MDAYSKEGRVRESFMSGVTIKTTKANKSAATKAIFLPTAIGVWAPAHRCTVWDMRHLLEAYKAQFHPGG